GGPEQRSFRWSGSIAGPCSHGSERCRTGSGSAPGFRASTDGTGSRIPGGRSGEVPHGAVVRRPSLPKAAIPGHPIPIPQPVCEGFLHGVENQLLVGGVRRIGEDGLPGYLAMAGFDHEVDPNQVQVFGINPMVVQKAMLANNLCYLLGTLRRGVVG